MADSSAVVGLGGGGVGDDGGTGEGDEGEGEERNLRRRRRRRWGDVWRGIKRVQCRLSGYVRSHSFVTDRRSVNRCRRYDSVDIVDVFFCGRCLGPNEPRNCTVQEFELGCGGGYGAAVRCVFDFV